MVEKLVEIGILFDFYGKLLSTRQFYVIELFYIHDLSLAEIGEELKITRQGVYDTLKRAERKLYEYEKTLGLVSKFKKNQEYAQKVVRLADEIKKNSNGKINNTDKDVWRKSEEIRGLGLKILSNS